MASVHIFSNYTQVVDTITIDGIYTFQGTPSTITTMIGNDCVSYQLHMITESRVTDIDGVVRIGRIRSINDKWVDLEVGNLIIKTKYISITSSIDRYTLNSHPNAIVSYIVEDGISWTSQLILDATHSRVLLNGIINSNVKIPCQSVNLISGYRANKRDRSMRSMAPMMVSSAYSSNDEGDSSLSVDNTIYTVTGIDNIIDGQMSVIIGSFDISLKNEYICTIGDNTVYNVYMFNTPSYLPPSTVVVKNGDIVVARTSLDEKRMSDDVEIITSSANNITVEDNGTRINSEDGRTSTITINQKIKTVAEGIIHLRYYVGKSTIRDYVGPKYERKDGWMRWSLPLPTTTSLEASFVLKN